MFLFYKEGSTQKKEEIKIKVDSPKTSKNDVSTMFAYCYAAAMPIDSQFVFCKLKRNKKKVSFRFA